VCGAVEIDMHLVIKSKDRPSDDERDARFGNAIARCSDTKGKIHSGILDALRGCERPRGR
jgi:hypothetical protein